MGLSYSRQRTGAQVEPLENPEAVIAALQAENERLRERMAKHLLARPGWRVRLKRAIVDFFHRPLEQLILVLALGLTVIEFGIKIWRFYRG